MNTSNAEFLATKGGQAATGPQSDSTSPTKQPAPEMIGAEMLVHALHAEGVEYVWGYPGGAVLFIYDEIFKQDKFEHILVRHEQAAVHAADGYARATGKVGVALVTSGPGVTNAVTGIATAYTDSIPMVIITGNVPTYAIGEDAFQEADTVGITRPIVKHNFLVKDVNDLAVTLKKAFHIARTGRPGPVLVDIPKDVSATKGHFVYPDSLSMRSYNPVIKGHSGQIRKAVSLLQEAERPYIYTGGGIIMAEAAKELKEFAELLGYPVTNTLMGLGGFPGTHQQFVGMLGMHGTYEANMAMNQCDVMLCLGARFDDRVTGRLDAFSPGSTKIHIDIDRSSINKTVRVDLPIVADVGKAIRQMITIWNSRKLQPQNLDEWWARIKGWRSVGSLNYPASQSEIMPQYAIERLYELTKDKAPIITTEVGQHQMWAAQHFHFDAPNKWLTSGGLGTMGYGLPAAIGAQMGNPDALVIDIAGEASIQMNIQEMGTASQYRLPVKVFILNNEWMGMVRQWQQLTYESRYSNSYSDSLPDFVALAEAYGWKGIRCDDPAKLDDAIAEMLAYDGPVMFDCRVSKEANCFPMIPSGAAHTEMILHSDEVSGTMDDEAKALV